MNDFETKDNHKITAVNLVLNHLYAYTENVSAISTEIRRINLALQQGEKGCQKYLDLVSLRKFEELRSFNAIKAFNPNKEENKLFILDEFIAEKEK